tara:strand:- start:3773 stop:4801 length:1029 start_codon:yes stop_codon:yes gene_type:complete
MDRIEFYNELILREQIRKIIGLVSEKAKQEATKKIVESIVRNRQQPKHLSEEEKLRQVIRKLLIKEAAGSHENTGVNYLDQMFKNTNIIDALKTGYQALTTDASQRESFRAHIVNAVVNYLAPERAMGMNNADEEVIDDPDAPVQMGDAPGEEAPVEDPLAEAASALKKLMELEVNVGDAMGTQDAEEDKKIETEEPEEPEMSEEEEFAQGMEGPVADMEDKTGRNAALETFKTVQKHIQKYYGMLGNEEDRTKFYDYLITNLKLYFNGFEEELGTEPTEPTTPEYEQEVGAQASQGEGDAEAVEVTEPAPEGEEGMGEEPMAEEPPAGGEMAFEDEEEMAL